MNRTRWTQEEDELLIEIFNSSNSAQEAFDKALRELHRSKPACSARIVSLRRSGKDISYFRTPKRMVTEYAKEIGNNLRRNPGNISATIREMSSRTGVSVNSLQHAWYARRDSLEDRRGRKLIFFSLMGDVSHPNSKNSRSSHGKRTKGLWKRLIEALRK